MGILFSLRSYSDPSSLLVSLQLADVVDNEAMQVYMKPSSHEESKAPSKGFVVRDAPWATVNNEKVSAACATGCGDTCVCAGDTGALSPWWQRKQLFVAPCGLSTGMGSPAQLSKRFPMSCPLWLHHCGAVGEWGILTRRCPARFVLFLGPGS